MPATAGAAAALAMAAESELGTELGPEAVGSALGTVEAAASAASASREDAGACLSAPIGAKSESSRADSDIRLGCLNAHKMVFFRSST